MAIELLDQFVFHHRLSETTGVALILFSAQGCGSCKQMRLVLEHLSRVHLPWSFYEVDVGLDQALAREFEVFHLPTVFVYRDGVYRSPLNVSPNIRDIEKGVEDILSRPAEDPP